MTSTPAGNAGNAAWWLDPGLAQLAFGTQQASPAAHAGEGSMHLAFLPMEALELDLSDPSQSEMGDYELREQIGQGGMGVVYRARQKSLEREVALKLLSAGPWASDEFIAGFRREARNAASLQHPNIVAVHEMGEHDGLVYYAMQLVRGESLAQCLQRRQTLPPHEAAALLRTVAEAVDYAHRLGVLHLDLKPGNILLDEQGTALVTDFGLARRLGQAPSLENEQISGTPSYMAPEQAQVRSSRLSAATDIWGIGAILHEVLTGTPPFTGESPTDILQHVLSGKVRRLTRHGPVPADLEAICLKCLKHSQDERYASARELADDLGRFLEHRSVVARPLNPMQRIVRWTRREPKFAIASALAVATLFAGLAATTQQWRRAQSHAHTANERLWEGRRESAMQLERQGKGWEALPRLLDNTSEQGTSGQDAGLPLDRLRIGLLLSQGATLVDTIVIPEANPLALALSDDGTRLAVASSDQSVRWYDTTSMDELGRVALDAHPSSDGGPRSTILLRFAGNDRLLATREWFRHFANPTDGDSWLLDLVTGTVVEPPSAFAAFADAGFAPDARLALLRDASGRTQAWATQPWRALAASAAPLSHTMAPWLLSPDERHAMSLDERMQTLTVHALPTLRAIATFDAGEDAAISAWAFSGDGRHAALGDAEGRIRLLSLATGTMRLLPAPRGREVTWVEFSADGAWLAAGNADGHAHAFDVASGEPLVGGGMEHDFSITRVGIDRAQRLLVASGEGGIALWRMPAELGPRALAPIRIATPPAAHARSAPYAIDWSMHSGLLATAGLDGQVRLWRMPASPVSRATMPRQLPELSSIHPRRVVDVEWNRLRTIGFDGDAPSDWIELPQPPGYAELTPDGRTLVATVGTQLRIYDAVSLRERTPPATLPATPHRFLLDHRGHRLLLGYGEPHAQGFGERLQIHDLASGKALPAHATLAGPSISLAFSPDDRRILSIGPTDAETTLLDSASLEVIAQFPHDPFQPIVDADFSPVDDRLWMVMRAEDPRLGSDAVVLWDPSSDAILARHDASHARPFGIASLDDGAFVAGESGHLVIEGTSLRNIARATPASDSSIGTVAASPDRGLVAVAARHGIHLHARDGTGIGSTLRIDTSAMDGIVDIAFSQDGTWLIARTVLRTARWKMSPDRRDEAGLSRLLERLNADREVPATLHIPSSEQRAALRATDPGAWATDTPRPSPALAGYARIDGSPIPARATDAPAETLDLTPIYSVGPDSVRNATSGIRPFMRPLPAGVQHMGDAQFDLRGMVDVGPSGFGQCIPVPAGMPVAAIHAMLQPVLRTPETTPRQLATLILRYVDGDSASIPIRSTIEVHGYGDQDHAVPLGFATRTPRAAMGFRTNTLALPRLANPDPGRAVHCLDLRTSGEPMLVLGLSVEPMNGTGRQPSVISRHDSR